MVIYSFLSIPLHEQLEETDELGVKSHKRKKLSEVYVFYKEKKSFTPFLSSLLSSSSLSSLSFTF